MNDVAAPLARHKTTPVKVGDVTVGGGAPVVVQSMTNTDTADVDAHGAPGRGTGAGGLGARAHHRRPRRGRRRGAAHQGAAPARWASSSPIIGDFHYIGHKLLAEHPACAEALDKYRINPGNVGFKEKKDRQFGAIIETALAPRQARAHRRQLGLARPGALDPPDGRERQAPGARRRARRDPRGDGAVGAALGRAARKRWACRARASSSPPRCRRCRT